MRIPSVSMPEGFGLPKGLLIPQAELKPPKAQIPAFPAIVIPPTDLEQPKGVKPETKTEQPEIRKLDIPIVDIEMPIPSGEVMVTAVTTAVAAVATTTLAQPLFDKIKQKAQKFLQKKVNKWKENRKERKDSSES